MGDAKGSEASFPDFARASSGSRARTIARAHIVERAQAGDRDAFQVLLADWLEPAFRTAMAIVGNEPDARDATQDAFLTTWRKLPQLRDVERFDAWLYRILINSCRGLRRGRSRVASREIRMDALGEADEPATAPREATEARVAALDAIERAWLRISVAERTILALHHLNHRPIAEIATLLGIPHGTAKSRLFHARRSLDQALEAEQR
jgi:RNA polymerase sigma-70 factor (ECF subfamily)